MGLNNQIIRVSLLIVLMFYLNVYGVFASPTVFPSGTTIHNVNKAYNGYVLFATESKILLIDMDGTVINTWARRDSNFLYAEPLSNGNILVEAESRVNNGKSLVELDWNNNIIWEYAGGDFIHHDFERLENNNTLILCSILKVFPLISPITSYDDYIIEVNPQGEIVWQWHTIDHFNELGLPRNMKQQIVNKGGDWAHTNSIQSLPANTHSAPAFNEGNILVSQRNTSMMYVINKNSGEIVWKLDGVTIGQHNATMLQIGSSYEGNILIFDNGVPEDYYSTAEYRLYSRIVVVNPVTSSILWKYTADMSVLPLYSFFSRAWSGAQMLPNGNILIVEGAHGRLFQVTSDGEIVWEYINNQSFNIDKQMIMNSVYRAHLVERDWALKSGK